MFVAHWVQDFATFLKKRAGLEEDHSQGLKKLARSVQEIAHRPDHRQGTYGRAYEEMNRIQERMADHGLQFAASLHQMSEDLQELALNMERGRKQWKQTGLSAEKRAHDATALAEKAKAKYDALAEQYDRAKTGDRQSGMFGLKVPKSAAQHEEDLHRKVQNADNDYQSKVQAARSTREELISTHRPQALYNLQQLIHECDSGLTLQLQKFGTPGWQL
jgi:Rho GTPase-activating protein RGD1